MLQTCPRCGYQIQGDARFCARCGRHLVPFRTRLSIFIENIARPIKPVHIIALSLCGWFGIGWLAQYFLVYTGLYFPFSIILLAVVLGVGGGLLGWFWVSPLTNYQRLLRTILIFIVMSLLLVAIWQLDRVFINLMAGTNRFIVMDIPGVHLEALEGYKRSHHVSNPPPYWLITMAYGILIALITNWILKRQRKSALLESGEEKSSSV